MNEPALVWAAVHSSHNLTLPAAGFGVATAFLFGLLGSVHCFGMCGPLISLSVGTGTAAGPLHRQLLLYNLGRVIVYTAWGFCLVEQDACNRQQSLCSLRGSGNLRAFSAAVRVTDASQW